jgi:hypothetical protein
MQNQKTLNQALVDLEKIEKLGLRHRFPERPENWTAFSGSMRERWGARAKELRGQSADAALTEIAYLAKRLRHTFAQMELLELDISTSATKNFDVQSALNFPVQKEEEASFDTEKLRWPFEDEVWLDEIDFMKAKNPSKCPMTAAAMN